MTATILTSPLDIIQIQTRLQSTMTTNAGSRQAHVALYERNGAMRWNRDVLRYIHYG